jgi:hypothetical protein
MLASLLRSTFGNRLTLYGIIILLVAGPLASPRTPHAAGDGLFGDLPLALTQPGFDLRDRLEILNLIHFYSHLADGLHTELFGKFFTEDARFSIIPFGVSDPSARQFIGRSRAEIVASMRPRHAAFRRDGIQRRHFLTNPIIWEQTDRSARVAVYLQLQSISQGGPPALVATGRYEGRAVKTLEGWRIAEWTIHSDQKLE